jgi:hypothetical protein
MNKVGEPTHPSVIADTRVPAKSNTACTETTIVQRITVATPPHWLFNLMTIRVNAISTKTKGDDVSLMASSRSDT